MDMNDQDCSQKLNFKREMCKKSLKLFQLTMKSSNPGKSDELATMTIDWFGHSPKGR